MKKVLRVMSAEHGDQPYEFETENAESTEVARQLFKRLQYSGAAVFNVENKDATQRVRTFSELGTENIAVPKFAGG